MEEAAADRENHPADHHLEEPDPEEWAPVEARAEVQVVQAVQVEAEEWAGGTEAGGPIWKAISAGMDSVLRCRGRSFSRSWRRTRTL